MSGKPVAILVPTFNNYNQLYSMLKSLHYTAMKSLFHVYVLNNGHPSLEQQLKLGHNGTVHTFPKNLGWEGALDWGMKNTTEEFVLFANDDIYFPPNHPTWLSNMLSLFHDPTVGAVGPTSNCVMGEQNVFHADFTYHLKSVKFLIGFCKLLRRESLEKVGGVPVGCPGGDDLDISIRLRKAGYKLIVDRGVYVHHHGFQTGTRVHGDANIPGGWNSQAMTDKTNNWLMRRHGVREVMETLRNAWEPYSQNSSIQQGGGLRNIEGILCASYVQDRPVLELGCGSTKTVPDAVGVDIVKQGENIPQLEETSVADIVGDVQGTLPVESEMYGTVIARHILEHCVDTIATLKEWMRPLKPGGRLIIAVPDETIKRTIPMNPEHVHAFNIDSLTKIVELVGLKCVHAQQAGNGVSLVMVCEKAPVPETLTFTTSGNGSNLYTVFP